MVFEILGCNLLSIVRLYKSKGLPLALVKVIAKQLLIALDFLHTDCSIIHTDLKPENVLLRMNPILTTEQMETTEVDGKRDLSASPSQSETSSTSSAPSSSTPSSSSAKPSESSLHGTTKHSPTGSVRAEETGVSATANENAAKTGSENRATPSSLSSPNGTRTSPSQSRSAGNQVGETNSTSATTLKKDEAKDASTKPTNEGTGTGSPVISVMPTSKEGLLQMFGNGSFRCKIADLGNACWTYKHFTDDVQTRHYRAPEIILGYKSYDTAIDIWSLACIVFELLTGDLLFEPHAGKNYTKDDDHLAQIMELLGRLPRDMVLQGKYSSDYLTRGGDLRNIKTLRFWGLKEVLQEKYKYSLSEATSIASFLLPMLEYLPSKRATARDQLRHAWIRDVDVNNFESCFNER
jgi:serine/threonine-protein kinase SRPK3